MKIDYSDSFRINQSDLIKHPNLVSRDIPKEEEDAFNEKIKNIGVTEAVIVVKHPTQNGKYWLLNGDRRSRGNKKAKHPTILAKMVVSELTEEVRQYVMYSVNNDGTPMGDEDTVKAIIKEFGKERILKEFRGNISPEERKKLGPPLSEVITKTFGRSLRTNQRYLKEAKAILSGNEPTPIQLKDLDKKKLTTIHKIVKQVQSIDTQTKKLLIEKSKLAKQLKPFGGLRRAIELDLENQKKQKKLKTKK
ncbi:ParB N-terminal domain-containing protein [Leptospira adleri]|uniref:Chromosome partitioning protein ParB n=1 Tax=Leptospira adleri TaxID=2023186 RepID=A0A2M9YIY3_9LEPT|nr:ParB N-terminal domain-containing protein [Leptospira adleri]PJZ51497.1 chromosome partitioning protein ParB [Leptospira adleri]PJZ61595.1 chromosome partitioning protein ParB [Leptospira adleri]